MLRLEQERKKRGWRLEDLAHFSKVGAADISRIENGRMRPYDKHAKALAKALRVKREELLQEVLPERAAR